MPRVEDIKYDEWITAQKMKFSITDFSSICVQIRSFLRIWSHLLTKSVIGNFIFSVVDKELIVQFKVFHEIKIINMVKTKLAQSVLFLLSLS